MELTTGTHEVELTCAPKWGEAYATQHVQLSLVGWGQTSTGMSPRSAATVNRSPTTRTSHSVEPWSMTCVPSSWTQARFGADRQRRGQIYATLMIKAGTNAWAACGRTMNTRAPT